MGKKFDLITQEFGEEFSFWGNVGKRGENQGSCNLLRIKGKGNFLDLWKYQRMTILQEMGFFPHVRVLVSSRF